MTRDPPRYDDIAKYDQLAHQLKQANDELKADFRLMLQAMFSQHAQLEEQRWAQFKVQVAHMEKEFEHQNAILCQHINNTIESHSTSLTSNFMKELNLLKRDVERIIDDRCVRHAKEDDASKSQATCESIANSYDQLISGNNNAPNLPTGLRKRNRTGYGMNKSLTGSSASLLDDDKASVNSGHGITFYNDCDEFNIPDIDEFRSSHRTFVRKLTIQPEQFWRARLIVKFNAAEELKVELRVAEGQDKRDSTWPLKIQGVGHIYNPCSRRFSEIWVITSVKCDEPPSDKYIVLPAKVCLSTTRDNYPDVTYDELVSKNYVDDEMFKFKWSLKVESA